MQHLIRPNPQHGMILVLSLLALLQLITLANAETCYDAASVTLDAVTSRNVEICRNSHGVTLDQARLRAFLDQVLRDKLSDVTTECPSICSGRASVDQCVKELAKTVSDRWIADNPRPFEMACQHPGFR